MCPFRLLDHVELWKVSDTRVLVLGGKTEVNDVLLHSSLRNTIHALYFILHPRLLEVPKSSQALTIATITGNLNQFNSVENSMSCAEIDNKLTIESDNACFNIRTI